MNTFSQGDIVMMNFTPQAGHEQAGRRPALVVSNESFHRYTRLIIVCPITSKVKGFPMHVLLDKRTTIEGEVLCEHVKSLDPQARAASFVEHVPDDILEDVLERIHMALD